MRWRKHVFIAVVSCCQLSLFSILIYLIRFCNQNPHSKTEAVTIEREKNGVTYFPNMAETALYKMSSFLHVPTTSTTSRTVFFRNWSNLDNNELSKFQRSKDDHTGSSGNHSSLTREKNSGKKTRLKLIVAILSAPIRFDRREGIRRTWINQCNSEEVVCRFFTDSLSDMEPKVQSVLVNESAKYGDLEFMPIPKGYNFGLRLLWLMEWSVQRYDFDFFLRMDDDYFVCLKRLLFEIPFRPQKRLYWGYVHCEVEGLVRVDEGFLILSADLVQEFMSRKDELLCHPFGDQTIAIWMNDVKNVIYFHDPRIFHDVTAHIPEFKLLQDVCGTYISLHGSYLHEMLIYWKSASKDNQSTYWVPSIQPISNLCPLSTRFDWRAMGGPPYGWEPKPCVLKPLWNLGSMHRGRNMM